MNIKDFKDIPVVSGDMLINIFERQRELMEKYHPIEKKNGLLLCEDVPVSLHDPKGQARLKDMFWRFIEELGEAMDSFEVDMEHFQEEVADALHFFVEAMILAGISPRDLSGVGMDMLEYAFNSNPIVENQVLDITKINQCIVGIMVNLSMAANTLKNKPWKQTHMMTDEDEFRRRIFRTWNWFIRFCKYSNISAHTLFVLYFQKSEVNKFRQRSLY